MLQPADIHSRNVHDTDTALHSGSKSNVNMTIEKAYSIQYLTAIVAFDLPVTSYEISSLVLDPDLDL